jgi:oligopeptide transport system permease protein
VNETLAIPGYINTEAFLSLTAWRNPRHSSWGAMISDGSKFPKLTRTKRSSGPHVGDTMIAFNFLGTDSDALDRK